MVALTQKMVDSGANLVRALDDMGAEVSAAFWSYFSEIDDWKLIICMPKKKGQKEGYESIQKALHNKKYPVDIRIDQIGFINPMAPIIGLIRTAITTGPGISNIRFSNNVINGTLIEDVHIYRIL
jgi:hypothetical protein